MVTLPTEIDAVNAGQISVALESAARHDAAVLIIDMSQTTFCDSAGVNAIIVAHHQAAAAGTQLRLVAPGVMASSPSSASTSSYPSTRPSKRR